MESERKENMEYLALYVRADHRATRHVPIDAPDIDDAARQAIAKCGPDHFVAGIAQRDVANVVPSLAEPIASRKAPPADELTVVGLDGVRRVTLDGAEYLLGGQA